MVAESSKPVQVPFFSQLEEALPARRAYLEQVEIPKLKEEFRLFHTGLSAIYSFFAAKGYIIEDPYKNDNRVNEITLPESSAITDNNRRDQLGRRISHLDNQFDYLCNFFPLSIETLSQDVIRQIMALLRFVEWNRITPDSKSLTTVAVAELVTMARKSSQDATAAAKLNDALQLLESGIEKIAKCLKPVSDYNRELYKFTVRELVINALSPEQLQLNAIKAQFDTAMAGQPFYKELIEEILLEDTGPTAQAMREAVLKRLKADSKKPQEKQAAKTTPLKPILIQGLNALGSANNTINDMLSKMQENHESLQTRKKNFFAILAMVFAQITKKEPDAVVYSFEVFDLAKNDIQKIEINFISFVSETEKKSKILAAMAPRGTATQKLESMNEAQLVALLKKNLRDVLTLHKTFTGLDDYFKRTAEKDIRTIKIKGIKPELSALKGAHAQANQKLVDYESEKETADQYKKLGVQIADV